MVLNGIEYEIEPNSNDRRVVEKNRILLQRDWFAVKTPSDFRYDRFSLWFVENCKGYWQYPVARVFWFSESEDVIKYYFDYHDLINFSDQLN